MMEHGYIIHFDNETDLVHYGIKGMKWGKHRRPKTPQELKKEEIDNTPGLDKDTKMLRKAAVDINYENDKKAQQKYGLVKSDNPFGGSTFIRKHKSAKKPLQTTKYKRGQQNLATLAGERLEKKLTKNLDSGKKMNKTYKMGPGAKVRFSQDSTGTSTFPNGSGYGRKAAEKAISRAYNKHINNVESKRPINRGKKVVKSLFNKIKKFF